MSRVKKTASVKLCWTLAALAMTAARLAASGERSPRPVSSWRLDLFRSSAPARRNAGLRESMPGEPRRFTTARRHRRGGPRSARHDPLYNGQTAGSYGLATNWGSGW